VAAGLMADMFGNSLLALAPAGALQVTAFTSLREAGLLRFNLDLNAAQLLLTFSGVVKPSTLRASQITLQAESALGAQTKRLALNDSTTSSSNGFAL